MGRRVSSARFIGRGDELAVFDNVLVDARSGRGDFVLIGGEAGVGKSRLVTELLDKAQRAGGLVLVGWCVEHGDQVMPLAPVADLLRDMTARTPRTELDEVLGPIS